MSGCGDGISLHGPQVPIATGNVYANVAYGTTKAESLEERRYPTLHLDPGPPPGLEAYALTSIPERPWKLAVRFANPPQVSVHRVPCLPHLKWMSNTGTELKCRDQLWLPVEKEAKRWPADWVRLGNARAYMARVKQGIKEQERLAREAAHRLSRSNLLYNLDLPGSRYDSDRIRNEVDLTDRMYKIKITSEHGLVSCLKQKKPSATPAALATGPDDLRYAKEFIADTGCPFDLISQNDVDPRLGHKR